MQVLMFLTAITTNVLSGCHRLHSGLNNSMPVAIDRLSSGLIVTTLTTQQPNLDAVVIWIKAGSRDEDQSSYGLAHLAEHIWVQRVRHSAAIAGKTDLDGNTNVDRTRLYLTASGDTILSVLKAQADVMLNLSQTLTRTEIARARSEVIQELEATREKDESTIRTVLTTDTMPSSHPYSHLPQGTSESVRQITDLQLHEWFSTFYVPQRTVVALVSGRPNVESMNKLRSVFASLPAHPVAVASPGHPNVPEPKLLTSNLNLCSSNLQSVLVWNLPGSQSPDGEAIDVIVRLLDRRLQSELQLSKRDHVHAYVTLSSFAWMSQLRIIIASGSPAGTFFGTALAKRIYGDEFDQYLTSDDAIGAEQDRLNADADLFTHDATKMELANVLAGRVAVGYNGSTLEPALRLQHMYSRAELLQTGRQWFKKQQPFYLHITCDQTITKSRIEHARPLK